MSAPGAAPGGSHPAPGGSHPAPEGNHAAAEADSSIPEADDAFDALRRTFDARTRGEIDALRAAADILAAAEPVAEGSETALPRARDRARAVVHRMGGTAGTLGRPGVCWTGAALEDAIMECRDAGALAEILREGAAALVDALERDLAREAAGGAGAAERVAGRVA